MFTFDILRETAKREQVNGDKMRPTFDIFTISPDGQPVWIESVETLENAREDLREAARIAPQRDCFIYSEESGVVEVVLRANFQELRKAYSLTGKHGSARSYRSSSADPRALQATTDDGEKCI